jgi:hypothetical protein
MDYNSVLCLFSYYWTDKRNKCISLCVCVTHRERERQRDRQREREREREREIFCKPFHKASLTYIFAVLFISSLKISCELIVLTPFPKSSKISLSYPALCLLPPFKTTLYI